MQSPFRDEQMPSNDLTSEEYERRRRWGQFILGGIAVVGPLLMGIPTWMFTLQKLTALGGTSVAQRIDAWLSRSRLKSVAGDPPGVMRYPRSALIAATAATAFFLVFAVFELVFFFYALQVPGFPGFSLFFFGVGGPAFIALATWSGFSILQCLRVRMQLRPDGLKYHSLAADRVLLWNDVHRLTYSTRLCHFRLESSDGAVVKVSAMLTGLPEFAQTVIRFVSLRSVDASARAVLKRMACGNLPRAVL